MQFGIYKNVGMNLRCWKQLDDNIVEKTPMQRAMNQNVRSSYTAFYEIQKVHCTLVNIHILISS